MTITTEINNYDQLKDMCWGENPKHVFNLIEKYNLEDGFFEFLDELFSDGDFSDTTINDYISYEFSEGDWIAEQLSLNDASDLDELKDMAKDLYFSEAQSTIEEAERQDKDGQLWDYIQENYDGYSIYDVMQELDGFDFDELEE